MTDLTFATMFTGLVILIWGFRALRYHSVNVLFFKMRSRLSTWIFGFVSTICGLLMLLTGAADANAMSAELVEILAKSGLYLFGFGWVAALIMEGIDRIIWRYDPDLEPPELKARRKLTRLIKRKRRAKTADLDLPRLESADAEACSDASD